MSCCQGACQWRRHSTALAQFCFECVCWDPVGLFLFSGCVIDLHKSEVTAINLKDKASMLHATLEKNNTMQNVTFYDIVSKARFEALSNNQIKMLGTSWWVMRRDDQWSSASLMIFTYLKIHRSDLRDLTGSGHFHQIIPVPFTHKAIIWL